MIHRMSSRVVTLWKNALEKFLEFYVSSVKFLVLLELDLVDFDFHLGDRSIQSIFSLSIGVGFWMRPLLSAVG
jgi:hypothetical protein